MGGIGLVCEKFGGGGSRGVREEHLFCIQNNKTTFHTLHMVGCGNNANV